MPYIYCEYVHNFYARPCLFKSASLQSVEVGSPNATYELTLKTAMPRGSVIPKGRVALPREPKAKPKDKVLVFADGKAADDARRAGADIVGGAELVEGVRHCH